MVQVAKERGRVRMSRRRSISTDISVDKRFNRIVSACGPFAGMLYLLMIPHADDDCSLTGDIEELMMTVVPGVRNTTESEVKAAIETMVSEGLVLRYADGRLAFPADTFYRYQSYVSTGKRITAEEQQRFVASAEEHRKSPQITEEHRESQIIAADQRETPENPASPSPSPSPSPLIESTNVDSRPRTRYEDYKDAFNRTCTRLPRVQSITEARQKTLRAWGAPVEEAEMFFQRVAASPWLNGENDRSWMADFDWVIKPANRQKIVEGKYDRKSGTSGYASGEPPRSRYREVD